MLAQICHHTRTKVIEKNVFVLDPCITFTLAYKRCVVNWRRLWYTGCRRCWCCCCSC